MNRLCASLLLIISLALPAAAADDYLESRLNSGLLNSDDYSYALMDQASRDRTRAAALLDLASVYSPDLPAVYFARARAGLAFSSEGILNGIDEVVKGIDAYGRNLWWSFTFSGGLLFGLVISFSLSLLLVIVFRIRSDFPLIGHELAESPSRIGFLAALVLLSAAGPLVFVSAALVLLSVYMSRFDRTVAILALVALAASPFIYRSSGIFLHLYSSGKMKAISGVNESRDNGYALAVLGPDDRGPALFSYALALKRTGRIEEAAAAYQRLLDEKKDAKVLVNLGNCAYALGQTDKAIEYYQKSLEISPRASAYYNLSQVLREAFRFDEGEEYFKKALQADRNAVTGFRALYGRNPNRIVVDETLDRHDLWTLARNINGSSPRQGKSLIPSWMLSVISLGLAAAFFSMAGARNRAYRCSRCGTVLCPGCEQTVTWGRMCHTCYRSLIKMDEIEVKERVARLLAIYESQNRKRRAMKILSFLLPGAAQIFAGKVLFGFLLLWPFLACVSVAAALGVLSPAGMRMHEFAIWTSGALAAGIYLISLVITRERMAKGWL